VEDEWKVNAEVSNSLERETISTFVTSCSTPFILRSSTYDTSLLFQINLWRLFSDNLRKLVKSYIAVMNQDYCYCHVVSMHHQNTVINYSNAHIHVNDST